MSGEMNTTHIIHPVASPADVPCPHLRAVYNFSFVFAEVRMVH